MLRHNAAVWGARRVMWRQADNPLAPSDKYEVRRTFSAVRLHSVVPTLPLHCQPFIEDVNCKRWWVGWDEELTGHERTDTMDIGRVEQPRSPVRPENRFPLMKRIMARQVAFKHFVAGRQHSCSVSTEEKFERLYLREHNCSE
ncbi:hypothetical protein ALC57_11630 [Trachymyrmex cornetzi]|uniref:Uncharacterized protein n=1 Tax=Trachymyrmex cornetzi TaxID=471704 RepID=A0A195DT53_9HYME|nr:hypothetical protein ALC57_11630 [Trachymyrmex cornetzi]